MFETVSLHISKTCDLECPFCYRDVTREIQEPTIRFLELVDFLETKQFSIGGGEPLLFPQFIHDFSKKAKKAGKITNITTNGKLLLKNWDELKDYLIYVTLISVSMDKYKVQTDKDLNSLLELTALIKKEKGIVGINLLLDENILQTKGLSKIVNLIPYANFYILHPKPSTINILEHEKELTLASMRGGVYFDEVIRKTLKNKSYWWGTPCAHGSKMISIDEDLKLFGCSFDKTPCSFEKRFNCPHVKLPTG